MRGTIRWQVLGLLLLSVPAPAQKRQYTMAEAVNGLAGPLAPKGGKSAQWRPGTHLLYYKLADTLKVYNADRFKIDTADVNGFHGQLINARDASLGLKNGATFIGSSRTYYQKDDSLYVTFTQDGEKTPYGQMVKAALPKGAANLQFHPVTGGAAFTEGNNLFYTDLSQPTVSVTTDTDPNIVNGQAVHRNEFGIETGIFFSPKGKYLAYYRMDQTMVKDYPVIDWSEIPAKNTNVKYPMAGDSSHQVTLEVYNITTQQTITLKTGEREKDHYLTCVTWSPDEKYIYIAILNRGQNHLWLNKYSAVTGEKVKTLFEEKSDKYVEPQHPLSFLPGSNTQFIWWSQRDGYMHLWLCDEEKNTIKCLTPGDYVVNELIGFNKRTGEALITSAKEDPREKHGYAVNWKNGKMRRLDTEPGTHTYMASEDGEYLFDVFTSEWIKWIEGAFHGSRIVARWGRVIDVQGKVVKSILDAPDPLQDFERPELQNKSIIAQDGTLLYGKLILPANFDKKKKYPVIVYLYNGPHVQLVKNAFPASGNLWYEYMAQHGYIVWVMDGRGSSNRGLKFEQATFRHLGTVEMEDQLRGVEYLKSLPFVDSTRMGVHGWSFGGFMTTSLMLRHPGVFKVGVAGGPVMDWRMYEIMYGERYMDTPQENPEGYKEAALFDKAKNLKGKLLLIHGTQDATVVWQHSINFLKAAVDQNVQVDYFVYPGYEHNVRGKDRVHLMQKVTDYFDQFLK